MMSNSSTASVAVSLFFLLSPSPAHFFCLCSALSPQDKANATLCRKKEGGNFVGHANPKQIHGKRSVVKYISSSPYNRPQNAIFFHPCGRGRSGSGAITRIWEPRGGANGGKERKVNLSGSERPSSFLFLLPLLPPCDLPIRLKDEKSRKGGEERRKGESSGKGGGNKDGDRV